MIFFVSLYVYIELIYYNAEMITLLMLNIVLIMGNIE